MKATICLLLVLGLLVGCATSPALVRELSSHSVTYRNTERILLTGSEGGYGRSVKVSITEHFIIQDVWDRIYQSRPYDVWYASGYRKLDFYPRGQPNKPSVTLMVNASDACHIQGSSERFRCPGMNTVLEDLLKREYRKRGRSKQDATGDAQSRRP